MRLGTAGAPRQGRPRGEGKIVKWPAASKKRPDRALFVRVIRTLTHWFYHGIHFSCRKQEIPTRFGAIVRSNSAKAISKIETLPFNKITVHLTKLPVYDILKT
jgi:hypothetical protein